MPRTVGRLAALVTVSLALVAPLGAVSQGFGAKTAAINEEYTAVLKGWVVGTTHVEALTERFDVVDPFFSRLGIVTLHKVAGRSVYTIGTYPGASSRLGPEALTATVRALQADIERLDTESDGDMRAAAGVESMPVCVAEFDREGVLTSLTWQ